MAEEQQTHDVEMTTGGEIDAPIEDPTTQAANGKTYSEGEVQDLLKALKSEREARRSGEKSLKEKAAQLAQLEGIDPEVYARLQAESAKRAELEAELGAKVESIEKSYADQLRAAKAQQEEADSKVKHLQKQWAFEKVFAQAGGRPGEFTELAFTKLADQFKLEDDGTVSIVIQPETKSSPPPAELTRPSTPIDPQNPSAMSDAKAITPPDKTAATLLLERILEPLEFNKANNHIDPTRAAALYARPLPLIEALQRSGDRSRRLWITQAYWQVSRGYANIRFATEARERLEFIAPGSDPHDQMVLDVASAAAEADLADAHAELIAAQQQLVDLVRLPIGEPAPWPVDRPLAGSYETHFAAIFATRPATGRIRAIDRMLPSKHDAVEARAIAVKAAESAMNRAESDRARG